MKVNKLAKKIYGEHFYNYIVNDENLNIEKCCTGKTTAACLRIIAEAIETGLPVKIQEGNKSPEQIRKSGGMIDFLKDILHKLELDFWLINLNQCTLQFNIFEEIEEKPITTNDILNRIREKLSIAINTNDLHSVDVYTKALKELYSI